jgi:hypothetical protein
MKWARLLMIVLLAALAFGGSFTCWYSSDGFPPPTTHPH